MAGISAINSAGNNTIQLGLTLTASQTFNCQIPGPSDRLTIAGGVDLGAFTLTFNVTAGSIINQNGVVSGTGGVSSSDRRGHIRGRRVHVHGSD